MVQVIDQLGGISGRLGKGFAKGLSEQVPKEIDRYRLSKGLQEIGQRKDQTPFEQFAGLAGVPGITPQMIESGSKLLKQQGVNNALMNKANQTQQPAQNPFPPSNQPSREGSKSLSPSITSRTPIEATLNPYIPKSFDQLQQRAGELLQENPALYSQDPEKAMQAAVQEDASEQNISSALQGQRQKEQDVQNRVTEGLREQGKTLNALVPGNVYSDIEDKAINAVKSKNEGGEGLTEQQAKKKYGDELDKISRDYQALETVGSMDFVLRGISKVKQNLKSIRHDFKERNDLENLADAYISQQKLSPSKAYYLAYPPSENKELNNALVDIPKIDRRKIMHEKDEPTFDEIEKRVKSRTLDVSKKLAKVMGTEGSPLAISEELKSRGYDPDIWFDYLDKNRKQLNLGERQGRELNKPRNNFPTLNDNWLFLFSGLDNLVEQ